MYKTTPHMRPKYVTSESNKASVTSANHQRFHPPCQTDPIVINHIASSRYNSSTMMPTCPKSFVSHSRSNRYNAFIPYLTLPILPLMHFSIIELSLDDSRSDLLSQFLPPLLRRSFFASKPHSLHSRSELSCANPLCSLTAREWHVERSPRGRFDDSPEAFLRCWCWAMR